MGGKNLNKTKTKLFRLFIIGTIGPEEEVNEEEGGEEKEEKETQLLASRERGRNETYIFVNATTVSC